MTAQLRSLALAVRIEDEIARRGIKLRGGVDRCGPCPRCGGTDRFSINTKKQVFNCRGFEGGDVIALVQHIDGSDFKKAVATLVGPAPGALRGAPGHRDSRPPAMIAAFGFADEPEPGVIDPPANVTGVHITRLTPDGDKAAIDPVKIMLGPSSGLPIVLAPANDLLAIDIAEGIEKGLLIQADTGAGMWVAGTAGRLPAVARSLPAYVECVTIWADRDETGLRFAREAARIIQARKIEVRIKGTRHE